MTELREDPITRRKVLVVPGRSARPNEHAAESPAAPADTGCPFCEGNEARTPPELAAMAPPDRRPNERGWWVRTIPNKFPTVVADPPVSITAGSTGELSARPGFGYHEVVIENPAHSPLLPYLAEEQVVRVVRMWRDRVRALSKQARIGSVTLFENAGPESGGSLWHPHAQLVATTGLSPFLQEEMEGAERYRKENGATCAFESVRDLEVRDGRRAVVSSGPFSIYAPFASAYPFELRFLPAHHAPTFADASDAEVEALADLLPRFLRGLLAIVPGASYNFVMSSPVGAAPGREGYHWHLDLVPRLVRPDGFDIGSGFHVNTVPPEEVAKAFRAELGAKS